VFSGLIQTSIDSAPLLTTASMIFWASAAEAMAADPSMMNAPGFQWTARGVSIRRSSGEALAERSRIVPAPSSKSYSTSKPLVTRSPAQAGGEFAARQAIHRRNR
jgi:hypothetical protein